MALDYLPSRDGFLGISEEQTPSAGEARAVVIPFGLEASVSYGEGTAQGPDAILAASHQVELFDEELWCEPFRQFGVATLVPLEPKRDIAESLEALAGVVEEVVAAGRFPLVLGGEHSLTPGAIRPLVARYPDLVVVQIDAHADLRDGYEGEPFSHAAAMRRCLDNPGVSVVAFGIRSISAEEIPFLEANRHRIDIHWARNRAETTREEIASAVQGRPVYISFDLDGLDASLMPATGTPEPGGLFWDDALFVLREVCRAGKVVGADVVELAPRPELLACDFLAARLAYKIMSYALS